jgi:flagellar L-ring protein precursor FlgH
MRRNPTSLLSAIGILVFLVFPAHAEFGKIDELKLASNMYSTQRAWKIGDLLTVVVSENTSSSKSETMKTEKQIKADAEAPIFGANPAAMHHWLSSTLNKHVDIPSYKIQAASAFDGKGSTTSSEALSARFTVRVVDVLTNGVLVVRGDRKILIRNESVSTVITGLVRPRDISEANSVFSYQLADAHIYYESDGEVSRGSRPGWVWRFFQLINPW